MPCQLATFFEENFSSLALVFSQDKENGKKENTNLLNLFLYNSKIMMIIKNEKKKTMLAVVIGGGGDYPHIYYNANTSSHFYFLIFFSPGLG
jgi:hypothetical protein